MKNVDRLKLFPNQFTDGNSTECTGITTADIASNIDGIPYSADFAYASSFRLQGLTPSTGGADPWADMQAACFYGMLPATDADITAKANGELFAANWQNYEKKDIAEALTHVQKPPMRIGKDFAAIEKYIDQTGWGVSVSLKWYASFLAAPEGVLTMPSDTTPYSYHEVACYGWDDFGRLIIKPWVGNQNGDNGYYYLSPEVFDKVGIDSFAFNPNGSRWIAIVGMLITRFPALASNAVSLLNANQGIMPPLAQSIYDVTKASLGQHLTLDPSVPMDVGCAESVSFVLSKAGVKGIPQRGFAGTIDLDQWLSTNKQFVQTYAPTAGCIVISPTVGAQHGHVGICGIHGICSNDSSNGIFSENYSYDSWVHYFRDVKGLTVKYYACA